MQKELSFGNGFGSNPGQFNLISGILAMPGGIVYICDNQNNRIQKMADNGTVLAVWDLTTGEGAKGHAVAMRATQQGGKGCDAPTDGFKGWVGPEQPTRATGDNS